MSSFKKTNTKPYVKAGAIVTPDALYWKQLGVPFLVKELDIVDYIDFSPVEPHYFAVTCSVRLQLYNPITKLVAKNLSRFREKAYGGCFRRDGRLICAGGEEASVKLFDVNSKSMLRLFKGHAAPVHRTCFTKDNVHITSFSDDKTIKIWDIPSEKVVTDFTGGHTDYIRAGCVSPVSDNIVLSGGYDQIVNMWDTRQPDAPTITVNHGSPIESILCLPSGGIFLSAGGNEIKVWDAFSGGRLLAKIVQHHRTVTCLRLASNGKRLLSSGLDRHVKIYDIATYNVIHTIDFPSPVTSLAVSSNDNTLVAGMGDGLISIHRREDEIKQVETDRTKKSYQYTSNTHPTVDTVVPEVTKEQLSKADACLRKFEYSKALDYVLLSYVVNKNPHVTVSILQELLRRKGLQTAISGRESKSILSILRFLIKYIGDYRFTRTLIDVANIFFDVYEDNLPEFPPEINRLVTRLSELLKEEEELSLQLSQLQGAMHMLLAGASVSDNIVHKDQEQAITDIEPSLNAQQSLVINVN